MKGVIRYAELIVTFETTCGTIKAELYPEIAPNTVNNFISPFRRGFMTA